MRSVYHVSSKKENIKKEQQKNGVISRKPSL